MRSLWMLLIVVILSGCDRFGEVSDAEYVSRAQNYLDNGEMSAASIELKNALSQNPNNPQARWLLGKLYLDIGYAVGAEKELGRARALGMSDQAVFPFLAKALLANNKYQEVLELVPTGSFSVSERADLLASRGSAYLELKQTDKAEQSVELALMTDPNTPSVYVVKAAIMAAKRDVESAREMLNKALAIDDRFAPAWIYLGDLQAFEGKLDDALNSYTRAIEAKKSNTPLLKRAILLVKLKKFELAQSDIDVLKKRLANNPQVNYAQALLYLVQLKYQQAQELFEQILSADPNFQSAYYFLGAIHYQQNRIDQAATNLSRYYAYQPNFAPVRKLLALIALKEKNYQQAHELVSPILGVMPDDVLSMNILANALLGQGKADEAIALLKRVNEIEPDSASARTRLGIGLLKSGDRETGYEILEQAIKLAPELQQADIALILSYLQDQLWDKALGVAKSFADRQPENAIAQSLLGIAYSSKKMLSEAEQAFEKARQIEPGDPTACSNLASFAMQRGDRERARVLYGEILATHHGHMPTMVKLVALEEEQGNVDEVIAILNRAIDANPQLVLPKVLLAQTYLRTGNPDRARSVLGDLLGEHHDNPAVLAIQGEIQLVLREFSDARLTLQRLTVALPNNAQAHYLLGLAYAGLNDLESLQAELEKSVKLAPDLVLARLALTKALLATGHSEQAAELLAVLKEQAPENPGVIALEGSLLAGSGDEQRALATFEKLFETNPNTSNLVSVSRLQWRKGDKEKSIATIKQWIEKHPEDTSARLELANAYLGLQQKSEAIEQYEAILSLSESSWIAYNNLAWNLRHSDPKLALDYAEKAYEIAPTSNVVLDTLVALLLDQGELRRAGRLLLPGLERDPGNPSLVFHQAKLFEAEGNPDSARKVLEALVIDGQPLPNRPQVEEMLARLKGQK